MRLGDYFVSSSNHWPISHALRRASNSTVTHAGIYAGNGMIVHSPGIRGLRARIDTVDQAGANVVWSNLPLTSAQRQQITAAALRLVGTPYASRLAIGVGIIRGYRADPLAPEHEQPWWVRRVLTDGRLMCSQLVERAYRDAGVTLFADGRHPGMVSPGALHDLLIRSDCNTPVTWPVA